MIRILLFFLLLSSPAPALAGVRGAPDAVVRHVYDVAMKADALGEQWSKAKEAGNAELADTLFTQYTEAQKTHPFWNIGEREKYFTEKLAALVREDNFNHQLHGTPEKLTYDPISDAAEPNVSGVSISTPLIENNVATVRVGFANWGEQKTLVYSLVQEAGAWKIDNIVAINKDGTRGNDLLQTLTPPPSPTPAS
ncbi:MAG: DUF3828 domain-containing protein [Alphaproteobacteria bacterium]|nr:DUF3828 domain-containing protein [Alphaproteobacteria bacterium]